MVEAEAQKIACAAVFSNQYQPRDDFEEVKLQELAGSIREKGILQPIIVRTTLVEGRYQIVAGERRLRAARLAGLRKIPAIVRTLSDQESAEIALIENLQRADLNAIEEAAAYYELMQRFKF